MLDLASAQRLHLEAQAHNEAIPVPPFSRLVAAELCADYALPGDWPAAYTFARQAAPASAGPAPAC